MIAVEQMAAGSLQSQGLSYEAVLQDSLLGWKFVVTKEVYAGSVPNLAQVRDVVAILKVGMYPSCCEGAWKGRGHTA